MNRFFSFFRRVTNFIVPPSRIIDTENNEDFIAENGNLLITE